MRKVLPSLSVILASALVASSAASAIFAQFETVGSVCNPTAPADASKLRYSQFGVDNTANSAASVQCGASLPGGNIFGVGLTVYDRNPAAGAAANLCCTIQLLQRDGNLVASAQRCSSGAGSAAQNLTPFNPPANFTGNVNLSCSIPANDALNGISHFASYSVGTTF